jgi:hypothetical protein
MSKAPSPSYSKAAPPYLGGTYEQPTHEIGGDIIIPDGAGAPDVELIAGNSIAIEDQSNSVTKRFKIDYAPYVPLDVNLSLIAKRAGVTKAQPVLKGTVIDVIELDWTKNKSLASQTLVNSGALLTPTLLPTDLSYDYSAVAVSSNITFTLEGNDGLAQAGSIDSSASSLLFGNNLIVGIGANFLGLATADLVTLANTLTKTVKTARNHTYFATGGVNQHHFVFYPKAWGLGTFTKGIFTGGYVRLLNVSGILKSELGGGDVESDILITNEEGFQEAYYAYMTLYDNHNDPTTSYTIS